MRKHAFGSVCVFGENNKNTISGVWIWRGQDLAFTVSLCLISMYACVWSPLSSNTVSCVYKVIVSVSRGTFNRSFLCERSVKISVLHL